MEEGGRSRTGTVGVVLALLEALDSQDAAGEYKQRYEELHLSRKECGYFFLLRANTNFPPILP